MQRINIFLEDSQIDYLKKLPGKVSEHVRIAVVRYIQEIKGNDVSASKSKRKGSE